MQQEFDLRRLQLTELQILKDVADFCDSNDITYFLTAGTLLGAARHKGFIPWDDDIDICMDLTNYKRFLKLSQKLPSVYYVQNYKTDKKCCYSWTKIMIEGTTLIQNNMESYDIHQGIFIDVFMINGVADGKIRGAIQRKALKIKKCLLRKFYLLEAKNEKPQLWTRIIPELMRRPMISFLEVLSSVDISKSRFCFSNEYSNISMADIFQSKDFLPDKKVKLKFEDQKFFCPQNYTSILETLFGEWNTIPPIEKRITHDICFIDFENDYSKYVKH